MDHELTSFGELDDKLNSQSKLLDQNRELAEMLKRLQTPWSTEIFGDPGKSHQGWLWKKRRSVAGWKKYYFSLSGNQIFYYRNEQVSLIDQLCNKSPKSQKAISSFRLFRKRWK